MQSNQTPGTAKLMSEGTPSHEPNWRYGVFALLTAAGVALCLLIVSSFLPALTWSIALAVALRKPYLWLLARLHRPALTALLCTLLVLALLVGPVVLLVQSLASQVVGLVALVQSGAAQDWATGMLTRYPHLNSLLSHATGAFDIKQGLQVAAGYFGGKLQGVLTGSLRTLTQLGVLLYTLFFLFRDGDRAHSALQSLLPLPAEKASHLLSRMGQSMQATILGSLSIAAIQGTLGGIMFAILGVPNATLWAFVMGMLATIPSLGTFLVWAPVAAYLALTGSLVKAAVLTGWGVFVIGTIDNILYPTLVSSRLRMHTVAVFFSVLGGIAVFGITGLVLGPLTLVTTVELLRQWSPRILPEQTGPAAGAHL